jgi:hypothetical protein
MDWEAIGAVGEILAAIAVLITLGYLAFQARQNSVLIKNTARDATLRDFVDFRLLLFQNREVAELYLKGLSGLEQLDDTDTARFTSGFSILVDGLDGLFSRMKDGTFDQDYEFLNSLLGRIFSSVGAREAWREMKYQHQSEFRAFVDEFLEMGTENPHADG